LAGPLLRRVEHGEGSNQKRQDEMDGVFHGWIKSWKLGEFTLRTSRESCRRRDIGVFEVLRQRVPTAHREAHVVQIVSGESLPIC
jgi:hypothetical protein